MDASKTTGYAAVQVVIIVVSLAVFGVVIFNFIG